MQQMSLASQEEEIFVQKISDSSAAVSRGSVLGFYIPPRVSVLRLYQRWGTYLIQI